MDGPRDLRVSGWMASMALRLKQRNPELQSRTGRPSAPGEGDLAAWVMRRRAMPRSWSAPPPTKLDPTAMSQSSMAASSAGMCLGWWGEVRVHLHDEVRAQDDGFHETLTARPSAPGKPHARQEAQARLSPRR